jgi:uncharacterized protein (TIGR02118 family)
MAPMVVTYGTPKNVDAFDRHYFEIHVPLTRAFKCSFSTRIVKS